VPRYASEIVYITRKSGFGALWTSKRSESEEQALADSASGRAERIVYRQRDPAYGPEVRY
jgi:hypothetical protein